MFLKSILKTKCILNLTLCKYKSYINNCAKATMDIPVGSSVFLLKSRDCFR